MSGESATRAVPLMLKCLSVISRRRPTKPGLSPDMSVESVARVVRLMCLNPSEEEDSHCWSSLDCVQTQSSGAVTNLVLSTETIQEYV